MKSDSLESDFYFFYHRCIMDYFFYMIGIFLWHLFYKIIYPWYLFIGVAHKSDMQDVYLLRNYGLTGFEALWQFPLAVLTSLSGLG